MERYIAYYRVSTKKQFLGIDAQKESVSNFIKNKNGIILDEFEEKESGKLDERIELRKAINKCKETDSTLLVAKLDRLSRNIKFIFQLKDSGVKFQSLDMPYCNTLTLAIMSAMAQNERELISKRTRDALAIKRMTGKKLGAPEAKFTDAMREKASITLKAKAQANMNNSRATFMILELLKVTNNCTEIARMLNKNGFCTSKGKEFTCVQVKRLIERHNNNKYEVIS